jgi:hypothetical protein
LKKNEYINIPIPATYDEVLEAVKTLLAKYPIQIQYEEGVHKLFQVKQAQKYEVCHGSSSKAYTHYRCIPLEHNSTFDHPGHLLIAVDDNRKVGSYYSPY